MAIVISESWIRERVQLTHNKLDDVRALSLPGTYHEKISSVGDSLKHFTRLKSLDLSRNAMESLAGLENLKMLEKLNLYYNNISNVNELYQLRSNTALQELDLRLNPIARTEPDYRLILVHMLPNLRTLDDRAVRDLERKAALMHFGTDAATLMSERSGVVGSLEQRSNPRAEHVRSLARTPFSGAEDDDEALLTRASRSNENAMKTAIITGSSSVKARIEEYTREDVRRMNLAYVNGSIPENLQQSAECLAKQTSSPSVRGQVPNTLPAGLNADELQQKYPNLYPVIISSSDLANAGTPNVGESGKSRRPITTDSNLQFADELDAYTSYRAVGHFTPNPASDTDPRGVDTGKVRKTAYNKRQSGDKLADVEDHGGQNSVVMYTCDSNDRDEDSLCDASTLAQKVHLQNGPMQFKSPTVKESNNNDDDEINNEYGDFIGKFSELADKYWNGSKSLLKNKRFQKCMVEMLNGMLERPASVATQDQPVSDSVSEHNIESAQAEIKRLRSENVRLQEKLFVEMDATLAAGGDANMPADEAKLKSALIRSQRDVSILRGRLQQMVDENKTQLIRLAELEAKPGPVSCSPPASSGNADRTETDRLQLENERLRQEVQTLTIRLKQSAHMQELAHMLQESHKSLVQTNEHLLHELNEARRHHDDQLWQLQHMTTSNQQKRNAISN